MCTTAVLFTDWVCLLASLLFAVLFGGESDYSNQPWNRWRKIGFSCAKCWAVHANIYIYTVYIYIYILVCLFLYPHLRVPYIFGTKTLVPNIYGTGRRSFSLISKVLGGQRKAKKWMQSLPWQKCTASQIPIFFLNGSGTTMWFINQTCCELVSLETIIYDTMTVCKQVSF